MNLIRLAVSSEINLKVYGRIVKYLRQYKRYMGQDASRTCIRLRDDVWLSATSSEGLINLNLMEYEFDKPKELWYNNHMRPIKFRVWEVSKKQFIYEGDASHKRLAISFIGKVYHGGYDDVLSDKEYIVQQYTGLKDSKGQEIYEGDILSRKGADLLLRVEYQPESAAFVVIDSDNDSWGFLANRQNYEVIGNIFQNNELLKWDTMTPIMM